MSPPLNFCSVLSMTLWLCTNHNFIHYLGMSRVIGGIYFCKIVIVLNSNNWINCVDNLNYIYIYIYFLGRPVIYEIKIIFNWVSTSGL